ncbi:hypothetical protein VitviT2T_019839 [Vitis vinifera]|uniref:Uncharacterized protein n=1 Tax=Vitis vinifera TaxID=29760 RepID=A0ABY9D1Z8_VITVI|nr:hypothetical protein VitviT2T_019839 [Vitis vinifera]
MARSDFETLFVAQMIGINRKNGRLRVSLSFAAKRQFRSKMPFSQQLRNVFRNCEMNVTVLRSGTRVPKSLSQLRNTLRNGTFVAKSGLYHFASRFAAAKWGLLCCEVALVCQICFRSCEIPSQRLLQCCGMDWQQSAHFAEAAKSRRAMFFLCFHSVFAPI